MEMARKGEKDRMLEDYDDLAACTSHGRNDRSLERCRIAPSVTATLPMHMSVCSFLFPLPLAELTLSCYSFLYSPSVNIWMHCLALIAVDRVLASRDDNLTASGSFFLYLSFLFMHLLLQQH